MPRHSGSEVPFCKLTQIITSHEKNSKRKSVLKQMFVYNSKFLFLFYVTTVSIPFEILFFFSALFAYISDSLAPSEINLESCLFEHWLCSAFNDFLGISLKVTRALKNLL